MTLTHLTLNLENGSVSFSLPLDAIQELKASLDGLIVNLKAVSLANGEATKKRIPQTPMEYRYVGEVFLEVFCNPNIWPTPFAAKILLTVRNQDIKLTTEADLTRVIEDVNQYLENI